MFVCFPVYECIKERVSGGGEEQEEVRERARESKKREINVGNREREKREG